MSAEILLATVKEDREDFYFYKRTKNRRGR